MSFKRSQKFDCLDLLREFTIQNKTIKQKDKYLYFDQNKFPLDTKTCFQAIQTQKQYNLGDLWFFLHFKQQHDDLKGYVKEASQKKVEFISITDRDDVWDYFTGKKQFTGSINIELKQELAVSKKGISKEEYIYSEGPSKKVKLDNDQYTIKQFETEEEQFNIQKRLISTEKPITTKTRLLRAPSQKSFAYLLSYLNKLKDSNANMQTQQNPTQNLPNCLLKNVCRTNQRPIIVVPQESKAGNVSLKNICFLLGEKNKYYNPEQLKIDQDQNFQLKHPINGLNIRFEIVDSIGAIKQRNEWNRIVAIFLSGKKYQIHNYPDSNQLATFFNKIRGFYVHYSTEQPNEFIKSCNYVNLPIHHTDRSFDKQVKDTFWEEIQRFMLKPLN